MPFGNTPFSLATAATPIRPALAAHRPSPISATLRAQIVASNYIDQAQLLQPSFIPTSQPEEVITSLGHMQLSHPVPSRSKNLTLTEFALTFSIFRDIICSVYPDHSVELDDYLSING